MMQIPDRRTAFGLGRRFLIELGIVPANAIFGLHLLISAR